ncbi:short-chain collagen C4-like [Lytechinus variegatus]|uniref:short-chain collagen C4-like n=1 Tax=Lytechinus variegatus TaxID=7654 RepID=UPI001BB2A063|nr:short-chain collagen C4-like [Lytechinus variegatus]
MIGPCSLCPKGAPGPPGPTGDVGLPGRDGRDGRDASYNAQQPVTAVKSSGVVYIRWGKDVCVNGSELVYAGTAAGARWTHEGGGANYLCMPTDPIYDEYQCGTGALRALLYSSEYETETSIIRLREVHDYAPKCAVCRAPSGRSTKLMIPARNKCPSDEWRLEYSGYLMSEYQTHKRSEFVCFDHDMEGAAGTAGDQNGALFYTVTAVCEAATGLPCDPYINDQELTCAVCTI